MAHHDIPQKKLLGISCSKIRSIPKDKKQTVKDECKPGRYPFVLLTLNKSSWLIYSPHFICRTSNQPYFRTDSGACNLYGAMSLIFKVLILKFIVGMEGMGK